MLRNLSEDATPLVGLVILADQEFDEKLAESGEYETLGETNSCATSAIS